MMKNLSELEKKLNYSFKDKAFLNEAIVHRSYINEHPEFRLGHNERLEFLGDAILEMVVTEYLFKKYPDSPEGELTNLRASLVNSTNLAKVAENLKIGDFLYMSKGESKDKNPKSRQYILANAFEAVLGAIYLDGGITASRKFVQSAVLSTLEEILDKKLYVDPKSYFQEMAQEKTGITPSYKVISAVGPDHNKTFTIGIYLGEEMIATGKGTSKQEAQTNAAQAALEKKNWQIK